MMLRINVDVLHFCMKTKKEDNNQPLWVPASISFRIGAI